MSTSAPVDANREAARNAAVQYLGRYGVNAKVSWDETRLFCALINDHFDGAAQIMGQLVPYVDLHQQIPVASSSTFNWLTDGWISLEANVLADTCGRLHIKVPRPTTLCLLAHYQSSWDPFLVDRLPAGVDPVIGHDEDGAPIHMLEMALLEGRKVINGATANSPFLTEDWQRQELVSRVEARLRFMDPAAPYESVSDDELEMENTGVWISIFARHCAELGQPNVSLWRRAVDCVEPREARPKRDLFASLLNHMHPGCSLNDSEVAVFDAIAEEGSPTYQELLHRGCEFGNTAVMKLALQRGADPSSATDGLTPLQVLVKATPKDMTSDLMEVHRESFMILSAALARQKAQDAIGQIDAQRLAGAAP